MKNDLETDFSPRGLCEEVIRLISAKKCEPDWLVDWVLDWRLGADWHWRTLAKPTRQNVTSPPIACDDIICYAAPEKQVALLSIDDVDPGSRAMFDNLGISLAERSACRG